jgi:hypothetical protein
LLLLLLVLLALLLRGGQLDLLVLQLLALLRRLRFLQTLLLLRWVFDLRLSVVLAFGVEFLGLAFASLLALFFAGSLYLLLGLFVCLGLVDGVVVFEIDEGVVVGVGTLFKYVFLELFGVEHVFLFLLDFCTGVLVKHPDLVLLLLLDELLLFTTIWVRERYCGGLVVCCSLIGNIL